MLNNFLNQCPLAFDCVHTYGIVCQRQILDKNDTPSFKWGLEKGYLPIWGRINLDFGIMWLLFDYFVTNQITWQLGACDTLKIIFLITLPAINGS